MRPRAARSSGKSEAEAEGPERRREPVAVRRLAVGAVGVPAAAPAHPDRALPGIGPLPHVAVHVAQPQFIRWVGANPRGASKELSLWRLAERKVAVEVGLI